MTIDSNRVVLPYPDLNKEEAVLKQLGFDNFISSFSQKFHDINFSDASNAVGHIFMLNALTYALDKGIAAKNPIILYIACSYGFGPFIFNKLGYAVHGIDIDRTAIDEGKKKNLDLETGDAFNLSKFSGRYDITMSRHFLIEDYFDMMPKVERDEHILNGLTQQYHALKPKGVTFNFLLPGPEVLTDKTVIEKLPFSQYTILEFKSHTSDFYVPVEMFVK